ncbi:hypothetical protein B0H19DRAFT_1078956 [Mycena capillaripes]|nr:hypothetical protein B0H19DRAFT_1078956 [Mycena capillaripes]
MGDDDLMIPRTGQELNGGTRARRSENAWNCGTAANPDKGKKEQTSPAGTQAPGPPRSTSEVVTWPVEAAAGVERCVIPPGINDLIYIARNELAEPAVLGVNFNWAAGDRILCKNHYYGLLLEGGCQNNIMTMWTAAGGELKFRMKIPGGIYLVPGWNQASKYSRDRLGGGRPVHPPYYSIVKKKC